MLKIYLYAFLYFNQLIIKNIQTQYAYINDVGAKVPDFDTYELFRATHSHNSPQYSHIVGLSSHFYAHIRADLKVFHPPMSKLM
ncbi:MAG TPA: hypothetical protein DGR27_01040 [Eubacterium sp.]|nr:hypothetical protein [Eubacterium sp.]